jgi:hypothetical protein
LRPTKTSPQLLTSAAVVYNYTCFGKNGKAKLAAKLHFLPTIEIAGYVFNLLVALLVLGYQDSRSPGSGYQAIRVSG